VTRTAPPPAAVPPARRHLISVVAPVYDEEGGIREFHRRTAAALAALPGEYDCEIVLVDDGSTDGTWQVLNEIAADDPRVVLHRLSRNFGHQVAITAGTELAAGDAVVVLDSDLQDPPELITEMVQRWRDGWDVVYGRRRSRAGESRFKETSARAFYRILNRMSDVELPLDAGDFRLMDRRVVDVLASMPEQNRYIRGMVAWAGFRQCALDYDRDPRHSGDTKYSLLRMLRLAGDAMVSFSDWPLTLATKLGFLVSMAAVVFLVGIVGTKIAHPAFALPGYASLMAVLLFLGGVQLLTIGILGQYVGRIYRESKRRPLYVVADTVRVTPAHPGERPGGRRGGGSSSPADAAR
jgi:polyisoprenyl-phosphate glycosyltransferase